MKYFLSTISAVLLHVFIVNGQTKIVAHRGYHAKKGSADNTVSSLKNAQELGVYGVEFDVNLTSDDSLIVFHGPWIYPKDGTKKVNVQTSKFQDIIKHTVENDQPIPTLREFLDQGKKHVKTRLVLEIKKHATPERETKVTKAIVDLVQKMDMVNQVEYLSFSEHICKELMRLQPNSRVIYVNGDLTPDQLKSDGYAGLSYNLNILMNKPEWIKRARELGLEVTLWMVNQPDLVEWAIKHNVDFVSSDDPVMVKSVLKKYKK